MEKSISIALKKYPELGDLDQGELRTLMQKALQCSKVSRFLVQLTSIVIVGLLFGLAAHFLALNFNSYIQLTIFALALFLVINFVQRKLVQLVLLKAIKSGVNYT